MLLENITMGKTLEIYVEREDYRYRLVSKVEDTSPKRVCVTAIASNGGRLFQFSPKDKVRIIHRDEDSLWEWENVEAGLAKLDDYPVHYFVIKDKGHSFNRRNAYRIQCLEETEFGYYRVSGSLRKYAQASEPPEKLTAKQMLDWEKTAPKPLMVKGMIKDISESGVGIYTDEEFVVGDEFYFLLPTSYGRLHTMAEVSRVTQLNPLDNHYRYYCGCTLIRSDQRLVNHIYETQREMLRHKKEKEDGYF